MKKYSNYPMAQVFKSDNPGEIANNEFTVDQRRKGNVIVHHKTAYEQAIQYCEKNSISGTIRLFKTFNTDPSGMLSVTIKDGMMVHETSRRIVRSESLLRAAN